MLNPDQKKLVIQAVKDKRDEYVKLVRIENAKKLQQTDIAYLDKLTAMLHEYNMILDALQYVKKEPTSVAAEVSH